MNIDNKKIVYMQETILQWYEENMRELPWRELIDPYKIWVSEVMSQQTQITRVIPKYHAWLDRLPTIKDVVDADKHTILSLWSGLGYNNRALRFQQALTIVHEKYNWVVPDNEEDLLQLPWVGPYTAHAILAFAYNKEVPVLDINIKRVLITMLWLSRETKEKDLRDIAIACIPPGESKIRHNALMDYGALVLTSKKTGIKSAKQSKFKWSRRWVRWGITKELVKHKTVDVQEMRKKFPHKEFDSILHDMVKDGLWILSWSSKKMTIA